MTKLTEILITCTILFVLSFVWLSNFSTLAKAPVFEYVKKPTNFLKDIKDLVNSQYQNPVSIKIKSVGINALIEVVGVEPDGSMSVPKNYSKIGWLKSSSKLGQNGNLVLSGHYDTLTGGPAVFYKLPIVKENDIITVNTELPSGLINTKEYKITQIYQVDPNNNDHVQEVYKNTSHPTITLITCNGVWDNVKKEYSHRVVVKGELIN